MKLLDLVCGIALGLLFSSWMSSCTPGPDPQCIERMEAEKRLHADLEKYRSTWDRIINERKIDEINAENFDEGITLVTSPENVVGIPAFQEYYNNYLVGFSDVEFTIIDIFGQGDRIVKHWRFKGTHTGDFFGWPATGKQIDIDGVTLVKMKDGRILQEQDFMDTYVFNQQIGLIDME